MKALALEDINIKTEMVWALTTTGREQDSQKMHEIEVEGRQPRGRPR